MPHKLDTSSACGLNILYVTPEAYPLVKTGGLGDVSGALPAALRQRGADVRMLLPGFPPVLDGIANKRKVAEISAFPAAGTAKIFQGEMPFTDVPAYVLDFPPFYDRDGGPYQDATGADWHDNAWRFALLSHAGALIAAGQTSIKWHPSLVQCNDWQTGLLPAYLKNIGGMKPLTVMGIHNLAYQGIFPAELTTQLGLPQAYFNMHGVEYYGNLSFLKAGLFYSDHITTVSPNYAREIQKDALGFGMQGLLQERREQLSGILNGIDTTHWNPFSDISLVRPYNSEHLADKAENKSALQRRLGLGQARDVPLLGMVSRITHQKGLDLLLDCAEEVLSLPAQIVLLGKGEPAMEEAFRTLAENHPGQVAATLGFSEEISHQIEAGADIFLMPSRFEPCGLNQMYSMRYGTPPIVHATGGLLDTVIDLAPDHENLEIATGFVFDDPSADALLQTIRRAISVWHDRAAWRRLQQNGMTRNFSWETRAESYCELYMRLARQASGSS